MKEDAAVATTAAAAIATTAAAAAGPDMFNADAGTAGGKNEDEGEDGEPKPIEGLTCSYDWYKPNRFAFDGAILQYADSDQEEEEGGNEEGNPDEGSSAPAECHVDA